MDDRPIATTVAAGRPMDRLIVWVLGGLFAAALGLGLATTVLAAEESASPSPAATTQPAASDDATTDDSAPAAGDREDCPEDEGRGPGGTTDDGTTDDGTTTPDPVTPDPTTAPSGSSDGV